MKAGGFSQWKKVQSTGWILEKTLGVKTKIAAIFDRDYRCSDEINEFSKELTGGAIICRVLERKEIENYALTVSVIMRTTNKLASKKNIFISADEILALVRSIIAELKYDAMGSTITEYSRYYKELARNKKSIYKDDKVYNSEISSDWDRRWGDGDSALDERLKIISGKQFLAVYSATLAEKYGINITFAKLIDHMKRVEVPTSIVCLIDEIETFLN